MSLLDGSGDAELPSPNERARISERGWVVENLALFFQGRAHCSEQFLGFVFILLRVDTVLLLEMNAPFEQLPGPVCCQAERI